MKWGIANMTWEVTPGGPPFWVPPGVRGLFRGRDGSAFQIWMPVPQELIDDAEAGAFIGDILGYIWEEFRWQLDRRYDVRMTWTLPLARTW